MSHLIKIKKREQSDFSTYIITRKKKHLHLKFFKDLERSERLKFAISQLIALIARQSRRDVTFQRSAIDHMRMHEIRCFVITLD